MKFRILEKDAGYIFYIQMKRRFWPFWYSAKDYAVKLQTRVVDYKHRQDFSWSYDTYKIARNDLDVMVENRLEFERRKKVKRIVRDVINMDSEVDKFLASI